MYDIASASRVRLCIYNKPLFIIIAIAMILHTNNWFRTCTFPRPVLQPCYSELPDSEVSILVNYIISKGLNFVITKFNCTTV